MFDPEWRTMKLSMKEALQKVRLGFLRSATARLTRICPVQIKEENNGELPKAFAVQADINARIPWNPSALHDVRGRADLGKGNGHDPIRSDLQNVSTQTPPGLEVES